MTVIVKRPMSAIHCPGEDVISFCEGQNRKLEQLTTVIEKLMEKCDGVERSLATIDVNPSLP